MHQIDLILTLTGGLAAALGLGYATQRLGLSPIVGYLLAGIAVGPHTPGFVANKGLADQLAEIGVILLMFGVGLNFHFEELLRVRRVAIPGAIGQSIVATLLGSFVGHLFGWEASTGLIFGLAISVASTVVLLRVLTDANDLHAPEGHIAVGWLVVEDLFTVLVLVMLPVTLGPDVGNAGEIAVALLWCIIKIGVLVGVVLLVGGRLIPWVLGRVAKERSRELFTLTVLVLALGIAVGAASLFGVSMALGAFLAGMVVGRSDFASRAASEALPMRDAFAVVFFVSVGMLFDPAFVIERPFLVAATLAVVVVAKPLVALLIVVVLGYPLRTALAVAVALAQIGEFSFILAGVGKSLGLFPDAATSALVAASIVSIAINPLLYRGVDRVERRLARSRRLGRLLRRFGRETAALIEGTRDEDESRSSTIVVGYGPVGRTLARLLEENHVRTTVIDLNVATIQSLKGQGRNAIYGDAAHRDTLIAAGVERSDALIVSIDAPKGVDEMIRIAKEINPKIRVITRVRYLADAQALQKLGADEVFSAEGELAMTMTTRLLRRFGATEEQIDRERHRIRVEFFGTSAEAARADDVLMPRTPPSP